MMADPHRQYWNAQQQKLKRALQRAESHQQAVDLFLEQQAMLHAQALGCAGLWSFEDEVWQGLEDAGARRIPGAMPHSIVWLLWHTARCEDITFSLLVAGSDQVLHCQGWVERLGVEAVDTGNLMDAAQMEQFSAAIDIPALRAYRLAVAQNTRATVQNLPVGGFLQKVQPQRAQRILAERAVLEGARGLVDYWASRTTGGLVMMPATRHHLVHLNEALRVKKSRS